METIAFVIWTGSVNFVIKVLYL